MHLRCIVENHGSSVASALRKSVAGPAADSGQLDSGFREALEERREWLGQRRRSYTEAPDRSDATEVLNS